MNVDPFIDQVIAACLGSTVIWSGVSWWIATKRNTIAERERREHQHEQMMRRERTEAGKPPPISVPCNQLSPDSRLLCELLPFHVNVHANGSATWYGSVWFDLPAYIGADDGEPLPWRAIMASTPNGAQRPNQAAIRRP